MRSGLPVVAVAALAAAPAAARVPAIPLSDLVQFSQVIVVARVESIQKLSGGGRRATARVSEVWKGTPGASVPFGASKTWTCDTSDAKLGETVVLFLTRKDPSQPHTIAHVGRGRMPLRTLQGQLSVTISSYDVRLPKHVPTLKRFEDEWSLRLDTLRALVVKTAPGARAL